MLCLRGATAFAVMPCFFALFLFIFFRFALFIGALLALEMQLL